MLPQIQISSRFVNKTKTKLSQRENNRMASFGRAKLLIFLACSALTTASNGLKQSADIGKANYPPSSDDLHNDPHKLDPLYIPRATYKVTNNDPHHRTDSEPHLSDSKSDRSRFRRDSNGDFTTMVDRMEKISRVVNAISIQQGIINGTLKPDALISEFLNFGGLTISEIEAINATEVTKVVEEMHGLPKKLTKNDGIAKIESRFLMYESMLEKTKGIGKSITIPEFSQYLNDVKTLMNTPLDQSFLDIMTTFDLFVKAMDNVDRDDKKNKGFTLTQLTSCASSYSNVGNMDKFKNLLKDEILRNKTMFEPIDRVNQAILEFQNDLGVSIFISKDKDLMTLVGNNIGNLTTLAAKTKSSLSVLENLRRLFVTRHHIRGNRQLTQTPGYPNGISDFGLVFGDLKDSWIQEAVDGQSDALAKALDNLRDLKTNLQTSDGSFHLDSAEETKLMTTKAEMIELSEYAGLFNELTQSVGNIFITERTLEPSNVDDFQDLMLNILLLSDHLRALKVVVDVSEKLKVDKDGDVEKMLKIIGKPEITTVFTLLDNLRSSAEFKKVMKLVRTAEASIGVLLKKDKSGNDPKSVIEIAKDVDGSSSQMQPYLDGLGVYLTNMDTLRNVAGVDQVGEAIRAIQYYRNHTFKSASFEKISNKVNNAKNSLTKLQKSVANMKEDTTPESTALVELRDLFTDSQNIGAATRVFRSMQMAKDKKLVVVTPAMADVVKKVKNVSPKQQEQLNQLLGLDKELTTLIAAIGKIETSVKPSTSTDMVSLWPIFSLANGAKGISMDFLEISNTIEMLSKDPNLKSHQQDLLKIKNDLDTLDSMGLDYSKHQTAIKGTEESLKQLDLFFELFKKKITPKDVSQDRKGPLEKRPTSKEKNPSSDSRRSEKIESKENHHLAAKQSPNEPPPYFPNEKLRYQYFTELEYGKRVEDHRRKKRIAEKEEDSENNEDAETEVKLEPMEFVSEDAEIDEKPTRDEPTSFEKIQKVFSMRMDPLDSGAQKEKKPEKLSVTSPPKIQEKEEKPERFEDSGALTLAATVSKMSKPTQLIVKTIRERVPYYTEIGDSEAPTTIPQTVFRKFKTDHNKVPAYFEHVRPTRTIGTVPYVAYDHPALDVVTEQKPERFEDSGALTMASTVPKTKLVWEHVPYYPKIGKIRDYEAPTTSEAPKIPPKVLRPPGIGTRIDPPRKPVPYYCRKVDRSSAKKPKLTKVSGVDAKTLYVAMGGAPKSVPYYSEEEEEEEEEGDFEPRISEYDLSSEIQKQPERVPYFPEAREKKEPEKAEPVEAEPEEYVYDKTPTPLPANRQAPPLYVGRRVIARKPVAEQLTATMKSANPPRYASFLQKKQLVPIAPRHPIPVTMMDTFDSMDSGIESNGWGEKEPKKELIVLQGGWNGETMDTMNTPSSSSSGFLTRPSSKPSKVILAMELFNNQKHVPTTTPIKEPSRPHSDEFVDSAIEEMEIHLKTFSKEFSDANSKLTPAQRQMYGDRLLGSVKMFQAGIKKAIMKNPSI
ncbi:hypothetical protein GCK72_011133 [Caenorhabditis remanei]|uniref:Domain of unknown function WSN domain-containing protein n=1 Tax=Caenorhabditis remanei TaxID=31234 RepID=A0A6A5H4S8_CAERE|nr:hypothetical protein GCK72_011133 [Caenorhabditis remanei]KAF1762870.1 hypothetical protein GCK72_011133 [Caenorhabditis remanei]